MKIRVVGAATLGLTVLLAGCSNSSQVMDTGNGTYMVSTNATWELGGAAGANDLAYKNANAYCAKQDSASHAVVLAANTTNTYQGGISAAGGVLGGGINPVGNADLHFRCETKSN